MSTAHTTKLPGALRRVLSGFRRRRKLLRTMGGVFLTLAVFLGCVGVAVLFDRWLRLPGTFRAVLLAFTMAAFLFIVVTAVVLPALRRVSDRSAAARIGSHFPKMEEDLVTAVELTGTAEDPGVSHSLIVSVVTLIAERARKINYRIAAPFRPMLKVALGFLVLALLFNAGYLWRPEAVENALARLFQPNKEIPFFCYTKLEVRPGDAVIRTGDTFEVSVLTYGRPAQSAVLEARNGSGPITASLICDDHGRAETWRSAPVFEDLSYRVRAGDAVSERYSVHVVPPPALRATSAMLIDPDYAGSGTTTIGNVQGTLQLVQGTTLVLRVVPVDRGSDRRLLTSGRLTWGDVSLKMRRDESGVLSSPRFKPTQSGECLIPLVDDYGLTNRIPESVFIKVVPDGKPQVRIEGSTRDLIVLPSDSVEVASAAVDEFGLRNLALRYRIGKEADPADRSPRWVRRELKPGGVTVRELDAKTTLSVAGLGVDPGEFIEYQAEAADYADLAVLRRGRSRIFRITVLSEAEHLNRVLDRLKGVQLQLLRKAAQQKVHADEVGRIAKTAKETPANKEARTAQEKQRQLMRETKRIARQAESLIPELARNPSASAKLLAELEKLGRAVRSVARNPQTDAANKLGKAAQTDPADAADAAKQPGILMEAEDAGRKAARELQRLAKIAEKLQRAGILEKLAVRAEYLAARQKELKDVAVRLGLQTAGSDPKQLPKELKTAVQRLASSEDDINKGVKSLQTDIGEAARRLAYTKPRDAETAEKAGEKMRTDKVADRTAELARALKRNVLFADVAKHVQVVQSLTEVARILRGETDTEGLERLAKEIQEFIRRQTEINDNLRAAIAKSAAALSAQKLGDKQINLEGDVSEQASAVFWLAREIAGFRSETAEKLEAAAGEMKLGASDDYRSAFAKGLEHGEKALALLKSAREKLDEEFEQMQKGQQAQPDYEALLLLWKILLGQKKLIKETLAADRMPRAKMDALTRRLVRLAKKQSTVRSDTGRLKKLLAKFRGAAMLVGKAGEKMDLSRLGLENGDPGKETRIVQRQAVALLEELIKAQKQQMQGRGQRGQRLLAMLQMMQQISLSPGGYFGGGNAPILPAMVGEMDDEGWREVRSRFEGQLGAGFEADYPPRFRRLLEAYFERLRKEPPL